MEGKGLKTQRRFGLKGRRSPGKESSIRCWIAFHEWGM